MDKENEDLEYLDFNEEEIENEDIENEDNEEDIDVDNDEEIENKETDEPEENEESEEDQENLEEDDLEVDESEEDTQPKKKNGFQKRIDKINKKKKEAEERAEALELRLLEIEEKLNNSVKNETSEEDKLPTLADCDYDEDVYSQKLTEAIVKREIKKSKQNEVQKELDKKYNNYQQKFMNYISQDGREEIKERLINVSKTNLNFDYETVKFVTTESENGIGIHLELTKDLDFFKEFVKKPASYQLKYAKQLDEKLTKKKQRFKELKNKNSKVKVNSDTSKLKSKSPISYSKDMSLAEYRKFKASLRK